jgi:hypothetical protein
MSSAGEGSMFSAARSFATVGGAARTIVVQDAVRPYLAGAGTTNSRDFHKVFHSLCGRIPEQTFQRR